MKPPAPPGTRCWVLKGNRDRDFEPSSEWIVRVYSSEALAENNAILLGDLSQAIAAAINELGIAPHDIDYNADAQRLMALGRQYDPHMEFGPYDGVVQGSYYYPAVSSHITQTLINDDAEGEVEELLERLKSQRPPETEGKTRSLAPGRERLRCGCDVYGNSGDLDWPKLENTFLVVLQSNPALNPVPAPPVCSKCNSDLLSPNVAEGRVVSHTCLRCGETG